MCHVSEVIITSVVLIKGVFSIIPGILHGLAHSKTHVQILLNVTFTVTRYLQVNQYHATLQGATVAVSYYTNPHELKHLIRYFY